MPDIFGYNRTARATGQIASSEYAVVSVGGTQSLVQNVQVNYGQDIRTIFEIGNPNVYWVPGHASGTVDCTALVGPGGFFTGWTGGRCGSIDGISISTSGGSACFQGGGGLHFAGGIVTKVGASITAGTMEISQSVSVMVSMLMV